MARKKKVTTYIDKNLLISGKALAACGDARIHKVIRENEGICRNRSDVILR